MYADDLVLLSPSIDQLQRMVNICNEEIKNIGLQLNSSKSFFLRFGKRWGSCTANIKTPDGDIPRVLAGRYLGLCIVSGRKMSINFHKQKCKFYSSFNSVYSKLCCFNHELVILHLTFSVAIPCLMYGLEAFQLTKGQIRELETPWNRAFMKVF